MDEDRSEFPDLGGRTYHVPFRHVWQAALQLVTGTRGWTLLSADPQAGRIEAELSTPLRRSPRPLHLHFWLDEDGATRVTVFLGGRGGRMEPAGRARPGARFLRRLDLAVARSAR